MKNAKLYIAGIALLTICASAQSATYGGGGGTAEDPYQIWTAEQMNSIGSNPGDWGSHFKLMADVNMAAYTGTQYYIIGNSTTNFTGSFNGNNHIIRNLTYNSPTTDYVGLFGCVSWGAEIKNLGVADLNIIGRDHVGGLIGRNEGTVSNCYSTGTVSSYGHDVGGLIGTNNGIVRNCYSKGIISNTVDTVGGLIGYNDGTVSNCYSTAGTVDGQGRIGGLIGLDQGTVSNCYSTGTVDGQGLIGGLIGHDLAGTVSNCYSTGMVNGQGDIGGLIGFADSSIIMACFWDTNTSGTTNGVGNKEPDPSGAMGRTKEQMQTQSTFTDYGWDFLGETNGTNDYWRMCMDGVNYPKLTWQYIENGDFACPDGVAFDDLQRLSDDWLLTYSAELYGADADGDSLVNFSDFAIMAANWLQ